VQLKSPQDGGSGLPDFFGVPKIEGYDRRHCYQPPLTIVSLPKKNKFKMSTEFRNIGFSIN